MPVLQPGLVGRQARDHAVHGLEHRVGSSGCAASSRRSGIGSDSTL